MAGRLKELVFDTTISTNGGSAVTTYALDNAAIAGRRPFSVYGNNDQLFCVVRDNSTPVLVHAFLGTYHTGNTITVDSVLEGNGIWGSGTRNIYVSPPDEPMSAFLFALIPGATRGILVNDDTWSVVKRSIVRGADVGLADDFQTLANGSGAGGNITFTQKGDPLFRNSAATAAQRLMSGVLRYAPQTLLLEGASPILIQGATGAADNILRFRKLAADSWALDLRVGGAWIEFFTSSSFTYNQHEVKESNQSSVGGIQADTTLSISVPSTGAHRLSIFGSLHYGLTSMLNGAPASATATIDEKVGAGSFTPKRTAEAYFEPGGGPNNSAAYGTLGVSHHFAPSAGALLQYQLTAGGSSINGSSYNFVPDTNEYHSLTAILTRVS